MEAFLTSDEVGLRWMLLQACGDRYFFLTSSYIVIRVSFAYMSHLQHQLSSRDEICGEATRLLDISLQVEVPTELVVSYLWDQLKIDIIDPETGKEKSPSSQTIAPAVHQMVVYTCIRSEF